MEFEMPVLAELQKDVDLLKMLFNQRGSTDRYLEEVFRIRNKWKKYMTLKNFEKLAAKVHGKPFDRRVTENRFRILIELTCAGKAGKKSTYAAAIYNAYKAGASPSDLSDFFKKKGGIAKAAYG
jgi:hypothetical protein